MNKWQSIKAIVGIAAIILLTIFATKTFSPQGEPGATHQTKSARLHVLDAPALPSISEVQQMIVDRGYKIKVDGMVCASCYAEGHSETQENWDLAYNNQCALETWPK